MKQLIFALTFFSTSLLSLNVSANTLSKEQETLVIQQLNDLCSDSWCESATEFNFQRLECAEESSSCNLYFSTQDNSTDYMPIFNQVCQLSSLNNFDQMISLEKNNQSEFLFAILKNGFIEKVNECAEKFFH